MNNKKILEYAVIAYQKKSRDFATINQAIQEVTWLVESSAGDTKKLDKQLEVYISTNKPLAYIIGETPFCNLLFYTEQPVLIPRPETEEITDWVINKIRQSHETPHTILDLCSGSGVIGCTLAHNFPDIDVTGIDISQPACALAAKNKEKLSLKNITFFQSDLFDHAARNNLKFDMIISNPPYISDSEYQELDSSVTQWEDKQALTGKNNGLEFYEKIIKHAPSYLSTHVQTLPQIIFEIGYKQATAIEEIFRSHNYHAIKIYRDFSGHERWITARFEKS